MESTKLIGYLDSNIIATGFLIPIYKNNSDKEDILYTHILSSDLRRIISFQEFRLDQYKKDKKNIKENLGENTGKIIKKGHLSFFVYKLRNEIISGSYNEFLDRISDIILDRELLKQRYTEKIINDFGEGIITILKRKLSVEYSALNGIRPVKIQDYLHKKNKRSILKIIQRNDTDFTYYFRKLILEKNRRTIVLPNDLDIKSEGTSQISFYNRKSIEEKITIEGRIIFSSHNRDSVTRNLPLRDIFFWIIRSVATNHYTCVEVSDLKEPEFSMSDLQNRIQKLKEEIE